MVDLNKALTVLTPLSLLMSPKKAAAGLAISMFANNIGFITQRVKSIIFDKIELQDNRLKMAIWGHLNREYTKSSVDTLFMDSTSEWVRPEKKKLLVLYEWINHRHENNSSMVFRKGKSIIVATYDKDTFTLVTLRGMVNLKQLAITSVDESNNYLHADKEDNERFYVKYCYGRYSSGNKGESSDDEVTTTKEDFDDSHFNREYLKWDKKDIGQERTVEPFANLFYDEEVNNFIQEIKNWHDSEQWFKERMIPWRMGALLSGPPGTGKSSLAKALAQHFDFPIFIFDLTSMSNEELKEHWDTALRRSPCIVLIEDIDRVFDGRKLIVDQNNANKGSLSLDALLNCLSGIENSDGVLTLVTANEPEKLDPAMTRNGRLDKDLTLGKMSESNRKNLITKIINGSGDDLEDDKVFKDSEKVIKELVEETKDAVCAEVQSKAVSKALEIYWENF